MSRPHVGLLQSSFIFAARSPVSHVAIVLHNRATLQTDSSSHVSTKINYSSVLYQNHAGLKGYGARNVYNPSESFSPQ